jgi:hypothetical protein
MEARGGGRVVMARPSNNGQEQISVTFLAASPPPPPRPSPPPPREAARPFFLGPSAKRSILFHLKRKQKKSTKEEVVKEEATVVAPKAVVDEKCVEEKAGRKELLSSVKKDKIASTEKINEGKLEVKPKKIRDVNAPPAGGVTPCGQSHGARRRVVSRTADRLGLRPRHGHIPSARLARTGQDQQASVASWTGQDQQAYLPSPARAVGDPGGHGRFLASKLLLLRELLAAEAGSAVRTMLEGDVAELAGPTLKDLKMARENDRKLDEEKAEKVNKEKSKKVEEERKQKQDEEQVVKQDQKPGSCPTCYLSLLAY